MTDPIPDEAVEAALDTIVTDETVLGPEYREMFREMVVSILTAAAPLIAAQDRADLRTGIEALRDEWREQASHSARALHDQGHDYDIGYLRARNVVCADHADALDALLKERTSGA